MGFNLGKVGGWITAGAGVVTGNPALIGAGVTLATGGGGGGKLQPGHPGQPTQEAEFLLGALTAQERDDYIRFVSGIDQTGIWANAIRSGDAVRLAFEVAGGEDGRLTSAGGKQLGDGFWQRYKAKSRDRDPLPSQAPRPSSGGAGIFDPVIQYGKSILQGGAQGAQQAAQGGALGAGGSVTLARLAPWLLAGGLALVILVPLVRGRK